MSYAVPVERGKIREFAIATRSDNQAYFGADAVIPPTFLTTAANIWSGVDLEARVAELTGFDTPRSLLASEEFVFHGALPHAGQVLHADTELKDRWEKTGTRGGTLRFARIVTSYRDDDTGALVAEQFATTVEMSTPPAEPCDSTCTNERKGRRLRSAGSSIRSAGSTSRGTLGRPVTSTPDTSTTPRPRRPVPAPSTQWECSRPTCSPPSRQTGSAPRTSAGSQCASRAASDSATFSPATVRPTRPRSTAPRNQRQADLRQAER
jgi:hypothetical protein